MSAATSDARVAALVLAAGTSSRFGASKLTQTFRGKPLLQHALLAAAGACRGSVYLVVGHDRQAVLTAAAGHYDYRVENEAFASGLGSSIAAAIRASAPDTDAAIIMLADQPLVTPEHLNCLLEHWSAARDNIVATAFDDTRGPPILFPRSAFEELTRLQGDQGAKALLSSNQFAVETVSFAPAGFDVDRPGDLEAVAQD